MAIGQVKFKNHVQVSTRVSIRRTWKMSLEPERQAMYQAKGLIASQVLCPCMCYAFCLEFHCSHENYLLSAYYMQDTIPGAEEAEDNKTDPIPFPVMLDIPALLPSCFLREHLLTC